MTDKRNINRFRKRLVVRFGMETPTTLAFSEDLSTHGIFIKTSAIVPLGTIIQVELTLPGDDYVMFEGMVRWSKKVPPQMLNKVQKGGMGIKIVRFIAGQAAYSLFVAEIHSKYN